MYMVIPPLFALMGGVLVLLMAALVLWPQWGLLARIARNRLNAQRVLLEDALKYIFDCEYRGISCRLNGIAGNLHYSADRTARLLESLSAMGLVRSRGDVFQLTDAGRSYALRVIRVHRIWERYLADETGVGHQEWHGQADLAEHRLSPAAADELAAQMGNPVFDPHGDPIPSPQGELPAYQGKALHTLQEGELARILHIEDEPAAIFAQIAALGLYPGVEVYLTEVSEDRIRFAANGEECTLTPLFASNITVELLQQGTQSREKHELLSSLEIGDSAVVKRISPLFRGQQRRRLMDMGVVPGTRISAAFRSASGDPVAYRILGATLAIRKAQADHIYIQKIAPSEKQGL